MPPSVAYRELMDHTELTLAVMQARSDERLMDLAQRVRQGDKDAADQLKGLPDGTRKAVSALIVMRPGG